MTYSKFLLSASLTVLLILAGIAHPWAALCGLLGLGGVLSCIAGIAMLNPVAFDHWLKRL